MGRDDDSKEFRKSFSYASLSLYCLLSCHAETKLSYDLHKTGQRFYYTKKLMIYLPLANHLIVWNVIHSVKL